MLLMRMANFKALDTRAILPGYAYPGDAGMDFAVVGDHTLAPGESRDLPSGLAVEFPPGYWGRITGRSSTLRKHGLFVNEGVIDAGYRGELLTYVTNRQSTPVSIEHGTRLAQLILLPVVQTETRFVETLAESQRGINGFGSTGVATAILSLPDDGWERSMALVNAPQMALANVPQWDVYLGGPIDYSEDQGHAWRHTDQWTAMDVYCPICINKGEALWSVIIANNTEALREARFAVFDLRMIHHSIGTPVEIEQRIAFRAPLDVLDTVLVHPAKPGLFVKWWEARGAVVVGTIPEAAAAVRSALAQSVSSVR